MFKDLTPPALLLLASLTGPVPSASAAPADVLRSLFGQDTRKEPYDPANAPAAAQASQSVALLVPSDNLATPAPGLRQLPSQTLGVKENLCPGQRFAEQPAPGYCTGFLVGPDLLATAGHCVRTSLDCDHVAIVFGFAMSESGGDPTQVPSKDVYACRDVIAHDVDQLTGVDFALLRLDRAVDGRKPLALRTYGHAQVGDAVTVVGHPNGLPVKIAAGGKVLTTAQSGYFVTDNAAFSGNSGSPVINDASGLVEGVVVRGDKDFDKTKDGCQVLHRCDARLQFDGQAEGCVGEQATRVSEFRHLIPATGPSLQVTELAPADVAPGDDRGAEPGSSTPLRLKVRNDGTVDLPAARLSLAGATGGVTVTGSAELPPLKRGQAATLDGFTAVLDASLGCSLPAELELTATPDAGTPLTAMAKLLLGHVDRLPFSVTRDVPIPTADPTGATLALADVPAPDWRPVEVSVDVVHPDTDRLQVYVTAPNGRTVLLHDFGLSPQGGLLGRPTGRLQGTYGETLLSYESLRPLSWVMNPGTWTLKVVDHGAGSAGEIRGFGLTFKGRVCATR